MEWIKRHKLIISVFVLAIALFVIYSIYFSSNDDASLTRTNSGAAAEQELLALLASLKSIELDESLFSTPVFRSMVDFSQELTPESIGRKNPFLQFEASESRNSR